MIGVNIKWKNIKTNYRGDILIHAGKGIDKGVVERFKYLNLEYPSGQIIAKIVISDCIKVDDELRRKLKKKDPIVYRGVVSKVSKDWDSYGFKLEKIEPIKINGKLSLWDYDY